MIHMGFSASDNGPLWVFEEPLPGIFYIAGIDSAEGKVRTRAGSHIDEGGDDPDFNAISVIRADTGEQVASYMSNFSTNLFSEDVLRLAYWYGQQSGCPEDCFLVPESNSIGQAVIDDLLTEGYERIIRDRRLNRTSGEWEASWGFKTTIQTRDIIIKDAQRLIKDGEHGVRCLRTAQHFAAMKRNRAGKAEAPAGSHDDLAFAHMLALYGRRHLALDEPEEARPILRDHEAVLAERADRHYSGEEEAMDDLLRDMPW